MKLEATASPSANPPSRFAPPVARVLPPPLRDVLVAASRIEQPDERIRTIDRIFDQGRLMHPKYFK